ncbi:Dynamin-binding protein-like protein [Emericellopsis cladophorae]|uniref:Dynamin-binding protein-like protein n=1 Tax=Emericellopsis cladophorae TaxID=2686198 RepID=A0A9P9Y901_9HYPO|nr:Dynamin-binding protein-like protein [Emericellopsis cladophorae]KAI6785681.1 Dynamin-binding protein-like protein [Emericellopsis cladophorae]
MDSTGSDMDHWDLEYDEARQDLDLRHQRRLQHFHHDLTFDHDTSSHSGYAHDHNFASTDTHDHHASSIDPDDRYFHDQMASSSVPRPSLRSNGDGTTPRHPVVSPNRSLPRPNNVRSASNPVAATTNPKVRPNPNGKPSVKDLKKRFDQSGNGSSIPRTPGTRTDNASGPRVQTTWKGGDGANSYASREEGGTAQIANAQQQYTTPGVYCFPSTETVTTTTKLETQTASVYGDHSKLTVESAAQEPGSRRRKMSIGPIDFEQRREHIRLAYSKSVRESQALESRKRAAERRRRELEAATQAQAATESSSAAPSPLAREPSTAEPESPSGDMPVEHRPHVQAALDAVILAESPVDMDFTRQETMAAPSEETIHPEESSVAPQRYPVLETPPMDVPGSFPAFSPQTDRDEPPLSAVSATTETTEFDVDPQDEPSMSATPQSDAVPFTVKPPSPQQLAPVPFRAEYYSPFEDDSHSPSVDSESHEPVQPSRDSTVSSGYDDENRMSPVDAYEERFRMNRDQPPRMASSFSTTVTILPPQHAADSETVPFPRLDMQDDSDCHTDLDDTADPARSSAYGYDNVNDTCTEDADDRLPLDDCQSESQCDDRRSSQIMSSCATSDAGDAGYEPNATEPTTLLVPPSWSNRISQHSQWTDLTVESPNPSSFDQSPKLDDPQESPTYGHVTIFGSEVIGRGSDPGTRGSEHDSPRAQQFHMTTEPQRSNTQQLPNVDVGDDLRIPYLSENPAHSAPNIASPDHEPPPVPHPTSGSLLTSSRSSGYDDQSQYGSTRLASGRGSEEYMSQLETPRTIDTNSVGTPDQYFGAPSCDSAATKVIVANGDELTEKERHRLVQRRNVIKELVDTEAVFVRDMNIVEEIYKGTAEACPKLDDKTVKQIFRNTDEIISFHTHFLAQVKEAAANVYVMKSGRSSSLQDNGNESSSKVETSDAQDRTVLLGPLFKNNIQRMKTAHEGFLRSSDQAAKRLIQIQQDPTVKVWLNECNEVAKDLTAAWDLDSLLIKPMQRITKYPNLIITILQHTPQGHPDREGLAAAKDVIENAIIEINKTKKNFELVGQIVGRKRKESDGKSGLARAFGKRVDKLQAPGARPPEDSEYAKLHEKFGDDYLRLQVVLRDVEFYTRQISTYVREFLQYLSSVELVMRIQPGGHPELESKWVQFNISIRDIEKLALEEHLAQVRKQVIEPFELVIKAYGNPSLAMKKRQKRRLDYERHEQLKRAGKSPDSRLKDLVEEYEALNDTLKKELPVLSQSTVEIGNLCLLRFVDIQTKWFRIWKEKMKAVLKDNEDMPDLDGIVNTFQREFPYVEEQLASIGILNPTTWSRPSMSTFASTDDALSRKTRSPRPSDVDTMRSRGLSTTTDSAPSLPTPDFMKGESSTSSVSPIAPKNVASPHQYNYRDYYAGFPPATAGSSAGVTPEVSGSSRSVLGGTSTRPSTGRSFDSGAIPRQSMESQSQYRRDSSATYNSSTVPQEGRRFSGLFHSALPLPDGPEENKRSSSRASSMDRGAAHDGYNVLWLAASLFEFNIATTKHEAGYPYLIYQAGEIFDVIAEKGELWLAKNQDDASEQVGWIWSKHFAKLADS